MLLNFGQSMLEHCVFFTEKLSLFTINKLANGAKALKFTTSIKTFCLIKTIEKEFLLAVALTATIVQHL